MIIIDYEHCSYYLAPPVTTLSCPYTLVRLVPDKSAPEISSPTKLSSPERSAPLRLITLLLLLTSRR
jgi:hypothetical protein